MKRLVALCALVNLLFALVPVLAQTTYTWVGSIDSSWNKGNNWVPARNSAAATDIIVLNGAQTRQPTFTSDETVGRLVVSGDVTLTIATHPNHDIVLTVSGGSPNSFSLGSGINFTMTTSGVTTFNGQVVVGTGGGVVSGNLTLLGRAQLLCTDATNQLVFANATTCNSSISGGNPFGPSTSTPNGVRFQSGSTFIQNSGSDPFAAAPPASVVVFDAGSIYKFNFSTGTSATISLAGRSYPNVQFAGSNAFTYNFPVSGTTDGVITGSMTINSTISLAPPAGETYSGQMLIAGNIVNNGSWTTSTNRVVLNGASAQTISGTGTTSLGKGLVINNAAGATLQQPLTLSDSLLFTNGNLTLGTGNLTLRGSEIVGAGAGKCIVTSGVGTVVDSIAGNSSFVFPVSPDATDFNPLTIALKAGDPMESFAVKIGDTVNPSMSANAVAVHRTWTITEGTPGGNNATLTFQWASAQEGASFVRSGAAIWRNDGVKWSQASKGTLAGTGPFTLTALSAVSGFSPFVIANGLSFSSFSGKTLAFGNVTAKTSAIDTLIVKNTGGSVLNISQITSTDTVFKTSPTTAAILPSDSLAFFITFKPLAAGAKSASIIFVSNTAVGADTVSASGTGVQAGLTFRPTSLDMGSITFGTTKTDSMSVMNSGTSPLIIASVTSSDTAFKVTPLADTIAIGDSVRFHIAYKPGVLGSKTDTVVFTSNSAHGKDTLMITVQVNPSGVTNGFTPVPRNFDLSVNQQASIKASARIRYAVPRNAFVSIRVYDGLGHDIISLVNKAQSPGKYTVVWDVSGSNGTHISAGAYFYRMEAMNPDGSSAFVRTQRIFQQ